MAVMKYYPISPDANIGSIIQGASMTLAAQGFMCQASVMSPQNAMLTVSKDMQGINNIIGLGIECRCNITIMGGQICINIDSEWTNKIIAIAVGWFFCLVPFITGIIGASAQSGLPDKIDSALNMAIAVANGGQQPMPQQPMYNQGMPNGYQSMPQQPYNGNFDDKNI